MKRNGNITDFFRPFTEPKHPRAHSEGQRDRNSPFPGLSNRPHWPSVEQRKEHSAPSARVHHDMSSPTPPPEARPTHSAPSPTGIPNCSPARGEATCARPLNDAPGSSFTSSLSSVPPPSQSSTRSKRTMKDGMEIVRTSDSEEESDSSLEDLSTIIRSKKRSAPASSTEATPAVRPKQAEGGSAYDLRSHFKPRRQYKSIIPPRQKYATPLSKLVADHNKDLASKAKVLEAERKAEIATREEEESREMTIKLTKEGLIAALDDAENVQRTFEALQRTEALEQNLVWNFFEKDCENIAAQFKPAFPEQSLPPRGWQTMLENASSREQAFCSGIIESRIYKEALPDEIVLWMFDEICHQRGTALTSAYLRILERSTSQLRKLLDKERLYTLFQRLGAKNTALVVKGEQPEIRPAEVYPHDPRRSLPQGLRGLLELLRRAAPFLTGGTAEYSLEVLTRLSLDDSVRAHGDLQTLCTETIRVFITSFSIEDGSEALQRVSQTLFKNFKNHGANGETFINHTLQAQLIQSLPFQTPRESAFQRRLALAFFLNSAKPLSLALTAPGILPAIVQSLSRSRIFVLNRTSNYSDVTSAFVLLDIAVDSGFSDRTFVQTLRSIDRRTRDPAARQLRDAARTAEDEFNTSVDVLVTTVRRIMGQIRGSGTESVRMSEAKGAMERLVHRLESSVRTREKSGTDIFSEMSGRSAGLMDRWMGAAAGDSKVEVVNGNAPEKDEHREVEEEMKDEVDDDIEGEMEQEPEDVV